jgi:hypothetical protein
MGFFPPPSLAIPISRTPFTHTGVPRGGLEDAAEVGSSGATCVSRRFAAAGYQLRCGWKAGGVGVPWLPGVLLATQLGEL